MNRKEIKGRICAMTFLTDDEKIRLYQRVISQIERNDGFIDLPANRAALLSLIA